MDGRGESELLPNDIISTIVDYIVSLLQQYNYLILFPLEVVEGPLVAMASGFLSSLGYLNFFVVYVLIVAGDVTGDCLYYALGYFGRVKLVERWGRYIGINVEQVQKLETHFINHSRKTLVIGKLTHAIGALVLVTAGMAKMPFWKFVWYTFLPTLPKSLILILIGYYLGESYVKISTYLDYTSLGSVLLVIIFVATYIIMKKIGKKYADKDIKTSD